MFDDSGCVTVDQMIAYSKVWSNCSVSSRNFLFYCNVSVATFGTNTEAVLNNL